MRSSYSENNYGELLQQYAVLFKPRLAVELGILDGYSTFYIANGLKNNLYGHLESYDLFEDYQYKHGNMHEVQVDLIHNNVDEYVTLKKGDAYEVHKEYKPGSIDMLHVDISNTGKVVKDIIELWETKISERGIICFEGGSNERDNIEWMKKYNMPSIKEELETNEIINDGFFYCVYPKFPSMTVLIRKPIDYYGMGW